MDILDKAGAKACHSWKIIGSLLFLMGKEEAEDERTGEHMIVTSQHLFYALLTMKNSF